MIMAENILRTGTQYLKLTFKEFKDAKSRPILKTIDNYLHTISRNLNKFEFYDQELVYEAQRYYRNAAKQLSSVDKTLASLATETVQCVDYCKGLISNCHSTRDPFGLVQVKIKNLIDKSHAQLAGAIIQFGHIHEDINRILYILDEIKTRFMKAQERAQERHGVFKLIHSVFFIAFPLFPFLLQVLGAYDVLLENLYGQLGIDSTGNITNLADFIKEKLRKTKDEMESNVEDLTEWRAIVNTEKDKYERGNHVAQLFDIQPNMLCEEFESLKQVCLTFLSSCN